MPSLRPSTLQEGNSSSNSESRNPRKDYMDKNQISQQSAAPARKKLLRTERPSKTGSGDSLELPLKRFHPESAVENGRNQPSKSLRVNSPVSSDAKVSIEPNPYLLPPDDNRTEESHSLGISGYEDHGFVIRRSMSDFPVYDRPLSGANAVQHSCSSACIPFESENAIKDYMKLLLTPLLLPPVFGWFREKKAKGGGGSSKVQVSYISPCGRILQNMHALSKYLLTVRSVLPLSVFSFEKEIKLTRCYRVDRSKVQYFHEDLAQGMLEPFGRIPVFNCFANRGPEKFAYIKKSIFAPEAKKQILAWGLKKRSEGCSCVGHCSPNNCLCFQATMEVARPAYGLSENHTRILECNDLCGCSVTCGNRATVNTITFPLFMYFYPDKGWGVRASADIPAGSFVSLYCGQITSDNDDNVVSDKYLVGLDLWKPASSQDPNETVSGRTDDGEGLSMDGNRFGNVGRFFNHSCSPNMFAQVVHRDYYEDRLYDVAFFTNQNITAGTELTWDYKYRVDSIPGRQIECRCKTPACRKRML